MSTPSGRIVDAVVHDHGDDIRYVTTLKRWFVRDGEQWAMRHTILDLIRPHVRRVALTLGGDKGRAFASAQTGQAIERLLKSDRRVAVEHPPKGKVRAA